MMDFSRYKQYYKYVGLSAAALILALYRHGHLDHHIHKLTRRQTHLQMLADSYEHMRAQADHSNPNLIQHDEDEEHQSEEELEETHMMSFLNEMGWLEKDAVIPEEFQADVALYQSRNARDKYKVNMSVYKCSRFRRCRDSMVRFMNNRISNLLMEIQDTPENLMKPIATSVENDEAGEETSEQGICTPRDPVFPCQINAQYKNKNFESYTLARYQEAKTQNEGKQFDRDYESKMVHLTGFRNLEKDIKKMIHNSKTLEDALDHLTLVGQNDPQNVFNKKDAKVILIIPADTPVREVQIYRTHYKNYFDFFKFFNNKYIGVYSQNRYVGSKRIQFWFGKQDRGIRWAMRAPQRVTYRFPWSRFNNLMHTPTPIGTATKLKATFAMLDNNIRNKIAAEPAGGQDCLLIWFHQYLPSDLIALQNDNEQELLKDLSDMCTIIHIWVGFKDDEKALKVISYMQGILQPQQVSKTAYDPDMRDYFLVDSIADLSPRSARTKAEFLAQKIYTSFALERHRVKCLLSKSTVNVAEALAARQEELLAREFGFDLDNLDYSEDGEFAYLFEEESSVTTAASYELQFPSDYMTNPDQVKTEDEKVEIPGDVLMESGEFVPGNYAENNDTNRPVQNLACCGIGFHAHAYDQNTHVCCVTPENWRGEIKERLENGDSPCPNPVVAGR